MINFNKLLIIGITAAQAVMCSAFAQSPTIEEGRNSGYGIGGIGFGSEYEVDANGEIVRDANGAPVVKKRASSLDSSLKIINSMTGVSNVSTQANPGKNYSGGNSGGGASFQMSVGVDFRCDDTISAANPKKLVANGARFKITACSLNPAGDGKISVSSCYKGLQAANTCPNDSDYGAPIELVANGDFSSDGTLSIGVGCNASSMCRLTAKGNLSVNASSKDLDTAQTRESDIRSGLLNSVSQGDVAGRSVDYLKSYQACTQKNLDEGTFATCDKSYSIGVNLGSNASAETANCSNERVCTQEAVETVNTRKMCYREFEVANHRRDYEIGTKECHRQTRVGHTTDIWDSSGPGAVWWAYVVDMWLGDGSSYYLDPALLTENTCSDISDSLKITDDSLRGYWECAQTGERLTKANWLNICKGSSGQVGGGGVQFKVPTKYYDVKNPKVIVNQFDPELKPGSTCNPQVESDSLYFQCKGDWLERKLPADQCTIRFYDTYTGSIVEGAYDEFKKAGCGYCTYKQEVSVCSTGNSTSTCGDNELSNCSILEKKPTGYSGGNSGVITTQEEAYNCTTKRTTCVAWSHAQGGDYCVTSDLAKGMDKLPETTAVDPNWSKVAMASEMTDQINSGAKNSETPEIKLFTGSAMFCSRPVGMLGGVVQKNCCRTSITRPSSGVLTQEGCSEDEAKLAAARRKGTTHYVGDWCSDEVDLLFGSVCVERTEGYCAFNGLLAKVVQEQGRSQLAEIVRSGVNNKAETGLSFNYYAATDTGAWSAPVSTNGVKTAAWSWPAFCTDSAKSAQQMLNNPGGPQCGGAVSVWLATCTKSDCGALPANPGVSATNWDLIKVDPLNNTLNVASKFSVAKGACNTETFACNYQITAVPTTSGGMYIAQEDLSWQLFSNVSEDSAMTTLDEAAYRAACQNKYGNVAQCNSIPTSYKNAYSTVGDVLIMPSTIAGATGTDIPATISIGVSGDGGKTYTPVTVTPDGAAHEYTVAVNGSAKKITMQVACSKLTGICSGKAFVQVTITAMGWGSSEHPDCSGFSLAQFGALDFDKMDLSDWVNSLSIKDSGGQSKAQLAQTAMDQASSFNAGYNGGAGKVTATTVTDAFVNVSKVKGFGPFEVQVSFSNIWPYASAPESERDVVLSASIDWGDCSTPIVNQPQNGNAFMFKHTYVDPKSIWSACGKGGLEQDYTANLKVTVQLRSNGSKSYNFSILDYWGDSPSDSKGTGSVEPVKTTVPARDPRLPLVVSPNTQVIGN